MYANKNFKCRRARVEDIKFVREMIQELADFENMSHGPELSEADLIRDAGLAGGPEYCHIYVLNYTKDSKTKIIGYAICFQAYSTWQGKSYFLEDICVRQEYRGIGAGSFLFRAVAAEAHKRDCKRLDFHVLSWNPARDFYERLGAINLTNKEDWHFYRVEAAQLAKLAAENS